MKTVSTILFITSCIFSSYAQKANMDWYGDTLLNFKYDTDTNFSSKKDLITGINNIQFEAFEKGYLNFSLDSFTQIDSSHFKGRINLGPQYTWDKVQLKIRGPNIPNYLKPKLTDQEISSSAIANLYKRIITYYQNNGFPFTEINFDSLSFKASSLSGVLIVDVKQRVLFDTISIEGLPKLKTYFLQNYLSISTGKLYSEASFQNIEKKIKELPFVQLTGKPTVKFSKHKAIVTIPLKHKSANFINGIIGILPNSTSTLNQGKKNNLVVTGDLKLSLGNVFQHGEKIKLNWKRIQTETQQLTAATEIPYLFKSLFGISHELNLLKQDTSYITFKNKIGLVYSLGAKRRLQAFWENSGTNKLTDAALNNTNLSSINSATNSYGLAFIIDQRDYRFNPRKGFLFKISSKAGIKKLTGISSNGKVLIPLHVKDEISTSISAPQNSTLYETNLEFEIFLPIFKVTTIKIATNSGWLQNKYLLDNDLTRLGGFKLLRGFDEASIFTSSYSVNTIEYRILFEQNSHLALFYDQGIVAKSTLIENTISYPFGVGLGVNFQTKPGIFSVSYAVGKQNGNPLDLSVAKIHFGFVNLF